MTPTDKKPSPSLHTDGTCRHAKFRHRTPHHFRGDSTPTHKSILNHYMYSFSRQEHETDTATIGMSYNQIFQWVTKLIVTEKLVNHQLTDDSPSINI